MVNGVKKSKSTEAKKPAIQLNKDRKGRKRDTKEEKSRNIEEKDKVKKRGKGKETKEERSRNIESKGKNDEKKVEKKHKSKSRMSKIKAPVVVDSPILANKKKFCKKFFVEELDGKKLMRDFVALRAPSNCVAEVMKAHSDKCRYYDILCPDATRVVLMERPPENDFIHANWMTMPDKFRYISAQGPMEETLEDFWHMIYTEKSPAIVMICDWIEDGVQKCARYVPLEDVQFQTFGTYKVTRIDQLVEVFEDVVLQTFEISIPDKPDAPTHIVKHYHFRNWRDHTAPMTSSSVLKLLKALRDLASKGPPVIHCSAGIGRTATFIGVDYGNQRIGEVGEKLEVLDLVREMRLMRDKAVQSHHQFIFMLVCISDQMVLDGCPRNDDMTDLADFYKEFMVAAKKKREMEEKKKKEEAEKMKKEKEEKERKEKENGEIPIGIENKETLSNTQTFTQ